MLEIIGLFIGIAALLTTFYILFFDRVRLKIVSIIPAISGSRPVNDSVWKHSISSIQVTVKNKGKRDAMKCEGLVIFKMLDALPLFVTEKGHVIRESRRFDILAGEEKNLVAAWGFSGTAIAGDSGLDKGRFLEKAPPITVVINLAAKRISKIISEKEIEKLLRKHEEEVYKHS